MTSKYIRHFTSSSARPGENLHKGKKKKGDDICCAFVFIFIIHYIYVYIYNSGLNEWLYWISWSLSPQQEAWSGREKETLIGLIPQHRSEFF